MEANEMEAGSRDQGGQTLQEFQGRHDDMGGAIAVRGFEFQHDVALGCASQTFVAQGRTGDVSAKAFEGRALMRAAVHAGMQAKALSADTAPGKALCLLARECEGRIFPGQYFLARSRPECNAVGASSCLQGRQGRIVIGIGQVEVFRGFFNERAFSSQNLQDTLDDTRE